MILVGCWGKDGWWCDGRTATEVSIRPFTNTFPTSSCVDERRIIHTITRKAAHLVVVGLHDLSGEARVGLRHLREDAGGLLWFGGGGVVGCVGV